MCKFLSKSGGGPFQILFFGGDLTWNDPTVNTHLSFPFTHLIFKISLQFEKSSNIIAI